MSNNAVMSLSLIVMIVIVFDQYDNLVKLCNITALFSIFLEARQNQNYGENRAIRIKFSCANIVCSSMTQRLSPVLCVCRFELNYYQRPMQKLFDIMLWYVTQLLYIAYQWLSVFCRWTTPVTNGFWRIWIPWTRMLSLFCKPHLMSLFATFGKMVCWLYDVRCCFLQ